jgi:class 3 adenylate cyclase
MVSAMLPPHVVATLRSLGPRAAGNWAGVVSSAEPCVTIVFIDILDFVGLTSSTTPPMLVSLLDRVWATFDALAEKHVITKLETVGKEYVAFAGLHGDRKNHASACASFALDVVKTLSLVRAADGKQAIAVRIGVNTDRVDGIRRYLRPHPQFVSSDTTNVASRMSSAGLDGAVIISPTTYARIKRRFVCVPRVVDVKSKGRMTVYYVTGKLKRRGSALATAAAAHSSAATATTASLSAVVAASTPAHGHGHGGVPQHANVRRISQGRRREQRRRQRWRQRADPSSRARCL